MTKPSLNPNVAVAVCDKNDTRLYLLGANLDPGIKKDDVDVTYKSQNAIVGNVNVRNANVKSSVLILKMDKITRHKSSTGGDDEVTVVVTNPNTSNPSDPVDVPLVFEEGNGRCRTEQDLTEPLRGRNCRQSVHPVNLV